SVTRRSPESVTTASTCTRLTSMRIAVLGTAPVPGLDAGGWFWAKATAAAANSAVSRFMVTTGKVLRRFSLTARRSVNGPIGCLERHNGGALVVLARNAFEEITMPRADAFRQLPRTRLNRPIFTYF